MDGWSFLTNHGRVLLCIAHDPGVRLRDIAATVGITERSAYGIVSDLAAAGYAVKQKDGRRNRYQIQAHLPLHETHQPATRHRRSPRPPRGRQRGQTADQRKPAWGHRRPPAQQQLSPEASPYDHDCASRA
jgi:hypothetical protein